MNTDGRRYKIPPELKAELPSLDPPLWQRVLSSIFFLMGVGCIFFVARSLWSQPVPLPPGTARCGMESFGCIFVALAGMVFFAFGAIVSGLDL